MSSTTIPAQANKQRRTRFAIVGLALLALGLLVCAYQWARPAAFRVAVGPSDRRFVVDTHELELFGGLAGRWTTGDSLLLLPLPAAHQPLELRLALLNARPVGKPDPQLRLDLHQQPFASFPVARSDSGARVYRVLLPPRDPASWALAVGLQSDTVRPPNDARDLGVVVASGGLRPLSAPSLPPSWQLVAYLALATLGYATLRLLGLNEWASCAASGAALALLAFGQALIPIQIAPFTMRLAGLAALAAVYALGAHVLFKRNGQQAQPAAPNVGGMVRARSNVVPNLQSAICNLQSTTTLQSTLLLMGLAYWLMPAYQLIMTLDGVRGVTPAPATMVVGGVLLVAVLLGLLALRSAPVAAKQRYLVAALAVAAVAHLATMVQFAWTRQAPDFWIIYKAVRGWAQGAPLYNIAGIELNHFGHTFKVPPFYGMLFLPFVGIAGEQVVVMHRALNTVLLLGTLLAWFWAYRLRLGSLVGAGILLVYNMRPLADTIAFGQIDLVLLALLLGALIASERGHDGVAGALVAAGTLFKLYPVLLLAFFVVKGQWRALLGFVAAMVVLNGVALGVMGWEAHRVYLFDVLPRIGGGTAWVENQTLNGFLSRWAGGEMASNTFEQPVVRLLTYGGFVLAMGLASLLALHPEQRGSTRYRLQYAQFVLIMVLFVPAAWMHYASITVIAFVAVLLASAESTFGRGRAVALGLAYAFVAYGNQWSFFGGVIFGPLTLLGISYKFYGLLLLGAAIVGILLEQPLRLPQFGTKQRWNWSNTK